MRWPARQTSVVANHSQSMKPLTLIVVSGLTDCESLATPVDGFLVELNSARQFLTHCPTASQPVHSIGNRVSEHSGVAILMLSTIPARNMHPPIQPLPPTPLRCCCFSSHPPPTPPPTHPCVCMFPPPSTWQPARLHAAGQLHPGGRK
jgi:hypothetical protein